jgi:hypothetical protein
VAVRREGGQSGSRKKKPASGGHPSRGGTTVGGGTKGKKPTRYKSPTRTGSVIEQAADVALDVAERHPKKKIRKAVKRGRKKGIAQQRRATRVHRSLRGSKASRSSLTYSQRRRILDPPKRDGDSHINLGPLGRLNIEAELEGRGGVAKAAGFAKKVATSEVAQRGLKTSGPGSVLSTGVGKRALEDAIDLPAQAIPSAYAVGAGIKEAAEGRPQRIKKIAADVQETSPILLSAQGRRSEALEQTKKHPGLTALEVYGAGAAVSRGAGAALRAGAGGKPGKRLASTKRAPRRAPGTKLIERRSYSKGIGAKSVQRGVELFQQSRSRKLRKKAKRTQDPERRDLLNRRAAQADPEVMSTRAIARRTDEREDLAEIRRRQEVGRAAKAGRDILPKDRKRSVGKKLKRLDRETPRDHRSAVALLIAQNVVKPTRKSIAAYKQQLERVAKNEDLSPAEKRANFKLRQQLDLALRDKNLDLGSLVATAKQYTAEVGPRQAALVERDIVTPEQARMAPQVNYAVQEMGAKWNPKEKQLEVDGVPLPIERIEAHMRENDVDSGAYVSQAPGQRGARNFFSSWHEPRGISSKTRTGEAVRKGTFEVDREAGAENLARPEGLRQAFDNYAKWVGENRFQKKGERTDFDTASEAAEYRDNFLADSPYEWRVVATRPMFGRKDQSSALLDEADQFDAGTELDVTKGIQGALEGNGGGKYVLVPEVAARQMGGHASLLGSRPLKVTRKVGRTFSGTVLTTTGFSWPLGNIAEGTLRLAIIRAGPASRRLMKNTLAELRKVDPDAADDLEAQIGTGHLGSYEMQKVHTVAKEFQGTRFENVAKAFGALFRTPGPKQMGQVWNTYTRWIFGGNGWLEHQLRLAAAGRHLKNEGFAPRWFRDGPKAMGVAANQAARGMKGTPEQVQAARFVDRAMGKYSKWSPEMRFTVAVFTPFVAWAINAVKFFTDVLPRDHPILTGLLATSERATEEWRNSYGLGKYIDGAAPNWMQPSIVADNKLVPVGRFTPAGFFSDPLETAGSQILPQFRGVLNATQGLDWKGDPLNDKERREDVTESERLKGMASSAMGAFVPFFGLKERVDEKGAKTALNPFRGYEHNRTVSKAYNRLEEIEARKAEIKAEHPNVDSDNPTPEYAKLHREFRRLNEVIFRESKGKYGNKYKEPYEPGGSSGSSSSGSGWDRFRDGGGDTQQKSGWDQYRN